MSDLTPERLEQIEKAAKGLNEAIGSYWTSPSGFAEEGWGINGADYLANMDPATTLALIAEVKRQREALRQVREALASTDYCELLLDVITDAVADLPSPEDAS